MATTQENTEVQSINGQNGNVSVTNVDKAAEKAKVPNINFNVNVASNYEKLVALAAQQTDEDGNPYTVHRFAKESLFASLGLTMDGEVLRRKTIAPKVEDSLLAKALGADKVKAMTAGDRAKEEKRLTKSLSEAIDSDPALAAMVAAIVAKQKDTAAKAARLELAAILAK